MRIKPAFIAALFLGSALPHLVSAASGTGTASVAPLTAVGGGVGVSTMTYVVPAGGLSAGARLEITTPSNWYPFPQIFNSTQDGFVTVVTTAAGSFTLSVQSTAPVVTALLPSGSFAAGTQIHFVFNNMHVGCPFQGQTAANWKVRSVTSSVGSLADIASQPFTGIITGPAANLAFVPWTPLSTVSNQIVGPLVLESQDFCGNPALVATALNVNLSGQYFNGSNTVVDPNATFSKFSGLSPTTTSITISTSSSQTSFYYRTTTLGNSVWLNADYLNPIFNYSQTISRTVTVLAAAPSFNAVAIDNGITSSNLATSATLTPDNDGTNDLVVIRFTPSDATLTWKVTISSSGFTNTVFERWGTGDMQSGITWDGRDMFRMNSITSNATYTVKIEFPGLLQNTALTINLNSAQISGRVTLGGVGVVNAWINAQSTSGAGYSSAQTDASGNYVLNGLRSAGTYNIYASFTSTTTQANLYDSLTSVTAPASNQNFVFSSPGLIRVAATLTAAAATPIFGNINAHTTNYSKNYNASIRFQTGSTTSDNNDPFTPSTWSVMGVTPGSYVVETRIPGFAVSNQSVTVAANQVQDIVIPLVAKATVYGKITLPSASANYTWVPVEVIPSGSQQPLYWGGANINPGQSSGIYTVFGVDPGVYTFRARPQNYLPATISTTVAGSNIGDSVNGGLDFASGLFTTGGQLTGTLTIQGDSTAAGSSVFMNLSSQALGLYFNNSIPFTSNPTSVSVPYSINGLADGTYQVFPYLSGFETVPPGPKVATITSGAGTLNLTLAQVSGLLSGTVTLPGANSDYNQVHISLMGASSRDIDLSGASYSITNLPSGYYSLTATYATTGAQVRQSVSITNGLSTTANLDLSANTFAVNGTVSIQSGFTMRGSSGSVVTIGTVPDLIANATTQTLIIGGSRQPDGSCSGGTTFQVSTARVEAFPKQFGGFNDPARSGFSNCFGVGEYKYGLIGANGTYSIAGLTPGVWEVNVYPYFDGGTVPNVGVAKQVITITAANQTANFALSSGHSVAGTLSLPAGLTDTRSFDVQILSSRGAQLQSGALDIGSGNTPAASANFIFYSLADGDYSLVFRERPTYDAVLGYVTKYVGKPVAFTISGADLTGQNITLSRAARIVGSLTIQGKNPDGTPASTLVTSSNSSLLPSNFQVGAAAFPWVEGGFGSAMFDSSGKIMIDANNQWRIEGLVPGTYDLSFRQSTYGATAASSGGLNLAAQTKAQIQVTEGQTLDVGTISLAPGLSVSGTVKNSAGTGLSNIRIRGRASVAKDENGVETITDSNGQYTLMGLSPTFKNYDIEAAPRPQGSDTTPSVPYENVKKYAVDVTAIPAPTVNFTLASANSSISGLVVTSDSGSLGYPEDDNAGFPAAAIYLKRQGVQGGDDPLGEIRATTALDGSFSIGNLVPGTYVMTIASLKYRPYKKTILIGTGNLSLGTITLVTGPSLTTTLSKPNGNMVNTSDVRFAVAVTADVGSIIFGNTTSDSNTKNIKTIKFDGFELNKRYSVLLFDQLDNIIQPPEGRSITFTSDSDALSLALTYQPSRPSALTHVRKSGSDVVIEYYFTRPVRNTQTFDTDPANFVTLTTGNGTLSSQSISGDRRSMSVTYTPALGEQSAKLDLLAYSVDVDPSTNSEYSITRTSTLLFGQKASSEGSINAALGGEVTLANNNDPSGVTLPANSLKNSDGTAASADTSYNVSFNATDDISGVSSNSSARAATLSAAIARGPSAYLPEAWSAMQSAKASATLNPFSAFYSVLLPAGLSHTLNQTATLTLNYSSDADPTKINVYYYDGSKYLIESLNRTIDTANKTITVGVSHFSTFVVLQNSLPVVTVNGGVSTLSEIDVFNFPNPFDLVSKTKTLNHGGTTTSITTEGTVIRYVIPAAKTGAAKIVIYNVVGEKVRTIDLGTPTADTYNYVDWDGRNDRGNKVASGVYIGELKSGSNKRFFKMAVIK